MKTYGFASNVAGTFNERIEQVDEYQMQVPKELVRWKRFETGFTDQGFVEKVLKDVAESKGKKKKGKPYKSAVEMCEEYSISMQQLTEIIKAQTAAEDLEIEDFLLSGNTRVMEDGTVARAYSRAGVLMVEAIEEAYQQLNCPVHITGEYLCNTSWATCH